MKLKAIIYRWTYLITPPYPWSSCDPPIFPLQLPLYHTLKNRFDAHSEFNRKRISEYYINARKMRIKEMLMRLSTFG